MALPRSLQIPIFVLLGLVIGAVGATLFMESLPGAEGSPEARVQELESQLKQTENQLAAVSAADTADGKPRGWIDRVTGGAKGAGALERRRTLADGARGIAEDLRDGRPVTPEDIFRASQPLIRDLAPVFDRVRVRQQKQMIDSLTGEVARKYNLAPQQQTALNGFFQQRVEQEAARWTNMLAQDSTRLEDVIRESQNVRPDDGLDSFMETVLSGSQLASFKAERLAEKAGRVQREADLKVQRLNDIVGLDSPQRDQIFGIVARSSRDFDPSMALDGEGGEIGPTPIGDRQTAILSLLRPEQRAAYEAAQARRRDEAAKDLEAIGLALPQNWQLLDDLSLQ